MISIAMTTYNGEKFLREQIDSILGQDYSDFELVIVDDCSTDKTKTILSEYLNKDERIKLYYNEKNLGFIKNFEKAIRYCKGDYIAFSDQDDIWYKNHLSILLENIGDNYMICSDSTLIKGESEICSMRETLSLEYIPEKDDMFFYLLYNNFVQGSASMISKKLLGKVQSFPDNNGYFHDHWFAIYAASEKKLKYCDISTLKYRQHDSNVTENRKNNFFNYFLKKRKKNLANDRYLCLLNLKIENDRKKEIETAKKFYCQKGILQKMTSVVFLIRNYKKMYSVKSYRLLCSRFVKIIIG